jgi:hypothetical protein
MIDNELHFEHNLYSFIYSYNVLNDIIIFKIPIIFIHQINLMINVLT